MRKILISLLLLCSLSSHAQIAPFAVYRSFNSNTQNYQQQSTDMFNFDIFGSGSRSQQRASQGQTIRGYYISDNSLKPVKIRVTANENGVIVLGYYDPLSYTGVYKSVNSYAAEVSRTDGEVIFNNFNYKVNTQYMIGYLFF